MADGQTRLRTCVGCRRRQVAGTLLRWVVDGGGRARPDLRRRARGRGAYCCVRSECLRRAVTRGGLGRALRAPALLAEYGALERELLQALARERRELMERCLGDGRARADGADGRVGERCAGGGGAEAVGGRAELRSVDHQGRALWLRDGNTAAQLEQWDEWTRALANAQVPLAHR